MAVRSPPPQPFPKRMVRPPIKPRVRHVVNSDSSIESQQKEDNRHQLSPVQALPSSGTPSPNSPVNKFIYSPRQDSPVSPAAQCAKVAPLLPPNKKSLMNHFSNPHEKENGTDENHVTQQPNDYEKACGTFAQQRQRLKSAQLLQQEALERVLQDNRRQNEALRREFFRGEQQSQSSVLKISANTKAGSPQSPSVVEEPSEYLAPIPCGDYEFMDMKNLGNSRVVPPSEIRRNSDTPQRTHSDTTLAKVTKKHSKYSQSGSSWFSSSLLRYEDAIRLPDNSHVIIQGPDEFLFLGPTGIKMVTNCLPLFYVRPGNHKNGTDFKETSSHVKHELVRSSSTPAINEQLYDYARSDEVFVKHKNIHRQNSDVAATIVTSPSSTKSETPDSPNFERQRPVPKPRKAKIERSRSEANLVEDEMCDGPYPYETVSITFNNSAEKIYRDSSSSPDCGDLPPAPHTFELHFHSHSGWLVKLSKQKGIFGSDKWQKRYFVLNGNRLFYFKKYGDSQPRGSIELLPGTWCGAVTQGTPKLPDAQLASHGGKDSAGVVSVLRCIALHKPSNYSNPLCRIIGSNGRNASQSFRGHTLSLSDPEYQSRTYYFVTSSDTEQQEWVDAINANIKAHQCSREALDIACKELEVILGAVKADVEKLRPDLSRILSLIHSKREILSRKSPSPYT